MMRLSMQLIPGFIFCVVDKGAISWSHAWTWNHPAVNNGHLEITQGIRNVIGLFFCLHHLSAQIGLLSVPGCMQALLLQPEKHAESAVNMVPNILFIHMAEDIWHRMISYRNCDPHRYYTAVKYTGIHPNPGIGKRH
jgi:hypothetical protein